MRRTRGPPHLGRRALWSCEYMYIKANGYLVQSFSRISGLRVTVRDTALQAAAALIHVADRSNADCKWEVEAFIMLADNYSGDPFSDVVDLCYAGTDALAQELAIMVIANRIVETQVDMTVASHPHELRTGEIPMYGVSIIWGCRLRTTLQGGLHPTWNASAGLEYVEHSFDFLFHCYCLVDADLHDI
jgi:hypothetical protein